MKRRLYYVSIIWTWVVFTLPMVLSGKAILWWNRQGKTVILRTLLSEERHSLKGQEEDEEWQTWVKEWENWAKGGPTGENISPPPHPPSSQSEEDEDENH